MALAFQSSPGVVAGCDTADDIEYRPGWAEFQSSPGVVAGCDPHRRVAGLGPMQVSILTRRGGRVRHGAAWASVSPNTLFQSSPGVVAGCDPSYPARHPLLGHVSILTRRGGRVRPSEAPPVVLAKDVSILTRRGGRVRRLHRRRVDHRAGGVSILTRRGGRVRREPGENDADGVAEFQSSPGVVAGCDLVAGYALPPDRWVSILTRRGGRVRPTSAS